MKPQEDEISTLELHEGVTRLDLVTVGTDAVKITSPFGNKRQIHMSDSSKEIHKEGHQKNIITLNPGTSITYKVKGVKTLYFRAYLPSEIIQISNKD